MRIDGIKRLTPPGQFRHQITWQVRSLGARTASGQQDYTWADRLTTKCAVRSLSGRELENASRIWAEARFEIQQPYSAGMSAEWRGAWWADGAMRYLEVLDIQDRDGTGRWQWIIAREQK